MIFELINLLARVINQSFIVKAVKCQLLFKMKRGVGAFSQIEFVGNSF